MAPVEPGAVQEAFSQANLERALAGQGTVELREIGKRLAKGNADLQQSLEELEAEKLIVKQENAELRQAIDLMMETVKSFNIGADNTVEPELEEGPLDFLPRLWEKVRPRDTAFVVSEHVGEIRKPVSVAAVASPPQTDTRAASRAASWPPTGRSSSPAPAERVMGRLSGAFGSLWQTGEAVWTAAQREFTAGPGQQRPSPSPQKKKLRREDALDGSPIGKPLAAQVRGHSDPPPAVSTRAAANDTSPASAAVAAAVAAALGAPPAPVFLGAPATEAGGAAAGAGCPTDDAAGTAPPRVDAAAGAEGGVMAAGAADGDEGQIAWTVLVEAEVTLDDGTVQTLRVTAVENCRSVAEKFVLEHSLKACFEEPLARWLRSVEADAVTFPARVSGDLMEIRSQYASPPAAG